MTVTAAPVWRGCRLAARNASWWHGAHDFARTTLCGMSLAGSGMSEGHATDSMRECPACARVAAATAGNIDYDFRPAGTDEQENDHERPY